MPSSGNPEPWSYTRNQRIGLLLLLTIIASLYLVSRTMQQARPHFVFTEDTDLRLAAARLRAPVPMEVEADRSVESFRFNPNRISEHDLQRLGLSGKQAAAFVKFRDKRPFRSPSEIAKLYVLKTDQARKLVQLADVPPPTEYPSGSYETAPPPPPQRFPFDPNTVSADSLQMLGFTERETKALLKYRSYRPVTFRRATDLHRVSALDSVKVNEVLNLVSIALPEPAAPASPPERELPTPIDVNTAAVADWATLPGIGPYRAEKIVAYRESLGGFTRVGQVASTYGLPDSVFAAIQPYLNHSPITRPLFVNRLTAAELSRHPLLKKRTAEIIVRYRENHGPFGSATELKKVRALSTETLDALLPYLNFDR